MYKENNGLTIIPALDFTIEEYTICSRCGCAVRLDASYTTETDGLVCEDCFAYYSECACCGKVFSADYMENVHRLGLVCRDCIDDDYAICESCEEYYRRRDLLVSDCSSAYYCTDCYYDRYTHCEMCGQEVEHDYSYYNAHTDRTYCRECYYTEAEPSRQGGLHEHWTRLRPCFHSGITGSASYEAIPETLYFGMELELECKDSRADVIDLIKDTDEQDWYLEDDSSLHNGVEVVAHPRTFESWETFWYRFDTDILGKARTHHCSAHDTRRCGIHIHTSLDAWDNAQLVRLFMLIYNPKNLVPILAIAQRTPEQMRQWASLNMQDFGRAKRRQVFNKRSPCASRYAALNITSQTLEIRLFNSSLRLDRVQKNMEFVYALYHYTAKATRVSWRGLLRWITKNKAKVPNLYAFLLERALIQPLINKRRKVCV